MTGSYELDPELGYVPSVPLPFYCWRRWLWQKVRCHCGKTFISRDLGLVPTEYKNHYVMNHIEPLP